MCLRGYLLFGAGDAEGEVHRGRKRDRHPLPHVRHQDQGEAGRREEVAGEFVGFGVGPGVGDNPTSGFFIRGKRGKGEKGEGGEGVPGRRRGRAA